MQNDHDNGIIFSLQNGHVWVSSDNNSWSIKIGQHHQTLAAMRDFIEQDYAAKKLSRSAKKLTDLS